MKKTNSKQRLRQSALKALGQAIRNRRVDLAMSQEALGVKASLHRTYVTDIEGGLRNLSFLTMLRVAKGLDCTLCELICDSGHQEGTSSV